MRRLALLPFFVSLVCFAQTNPLDPGAANPLDPASVNPLDPGNPLSPPNASVPVFPLKDSAGRELRQWGNVIFPLEADSECAVRKGVCVIRPKKWLDLKDYLEIRVLPGDTFQGTGAQLQAWAKQRVDADFKNKDEENPSKIDLMQWSNLTQPIGPAIWMSGGIAKREKGSSQEIAIVAAFQAGRRAEVIVGVFANKDSAKAHSSAFAKFVENAQFVSINNKPLLGQPQPGPLDGVYWGTYTQWNMGLDGMMKMELEHVLFSFFSDGRFYAEIPPHGVTDFDFAELQPEHGNEAGNYYVAGDKVILHYANGTADEMKFISATHVEHGQAQLFKAPLPPDGYTFDGTRNWIFYSGFTPGVIQGGVSAASSIVFKRDGTYTSDASSGASGSFPDGAGGTTGGFAVGSQDKSQHGRYHVRGGRVFLTAEDGSTRNFTILFGEEEKKRVTWIGGQVLSEPKN